GTTYGLVFRVEDGYWENVRVSIDSETGSGRITSKAEIVEVEQFQGTPPDDTSDDQTDDFDTDDSANIVELDSDQDTLILGHIEMHVDHVLVTPPAGSQVVDVIVPETDEFS